MNEVQTRVIERAIRDLKALKCAYAVVTPDGKKFGDLKVVKPTKRRNDFASNGYRKAIKAMGIADVIELPIPDGVKPSKYHSVVSASACTLFGARNYGTAISSDRKFIEVIRMA